MEGSEREPIQRIHQRIREELLFRSLLAMGRTAPNPAVACVVYTTGNNPKDFRLCSGGTEVPGKRHAEIVALDAWNRCKKIPGAILTGTANHLEVTLEPCSVHGRTPPCTDRIVSAGELKEIFIGLHDPTLKGSGRDILLRNGRDVRNQRDPDLARFFLEGWTGKLTGKGSRFHSKVALTEEGVMGHSSRRLIISGAEARLFSGLLRSRMDAVLVGPGTVKVDHPGLDLRIPDPVPGAPVEAALIQLEGRWLYSEGDFCSSLPPREITGEGTFVESLFRYRHLLIRQIQSELRERQPDRIFILGRLFDSREAFFEKQKRITERTGVEPKFLLLKKHAQEWKNLPGPVSVIPDLHDPEFGSSLRQWCSERGYNEVLVEGGARIFDGLRDEYTERDLFYILQSRKLSIEEAEGRLVRPPGYFRQLTEVHSLDWKEDRLSVRRLLE